MVVEIQEACVQQVRVTENAIVVDLVDGGTITVPLAWYPRLWYGSPEERVQFEIIADGSYIHWPSLDEALSVVGILAGRCSWESVQSLRRWLAIRQAKYKG